TALRAAGRLSVRVATPSPLIAYSTASFIASPLPAPARHQALEPRHLLRRHQRRSLGERAGLLDQPRWGNGAVGEAKCDRLLRPDVAPGRQQLEGRLRAEMGEQRRRDA